MLYYCIYWLLIGKLWFANGTQGQFVKFQCRVLAQSSRSKLWQSCLAPLEMKIVLRLDVVAAPCENKHGSFVTPANAHG